MNIEENWLKSLSASSRRIYERDWEYFKEFTGMTTDQILESKKKEENGKWKSKLLSFKTWLIEKKDLSQNTARTATGVVRGFFNFYETPIRMTRNEKIRLDKTARSTRDYKFTRKDVAKMALISDLEEQYILLFGKSVGLRANDFVKFTYGDFRQLDLESEVPIYMGEFATQKKKITANPFIDSDSLPIIKAILETNKNKADSERVITVRGGELSVILQRIADKANIQHGDARIRFHCLRKWLITRLSASMAESSWKQIVGKAISEDAYVSTDLLRTAYKNALKDISVMKGGNGHSAKVELLEKAIKQLEDENAGRKTRIDLLQDELKTVKEDKTELEKKFEDGAKSLEKLQEQVKVLSDAFLVYQEGVKQELQKKAKK
jgi:integrase